MLDDLIGEQPQAELHTAISANMQPSFALGMLCQHTRKAKRLINLAVQVFCEAGVVPPQHLEQKPMQGFATEAQQRQV